MSFRRLILGKRGEGLAEKYLKKQGYQIIQTNYRCSLGELDIIANDHGILVFAEVKTRVSETHGPPQAAVTPVKQRKLGQIAQSYLSFHELHRVDCRFDVVAIHLSAKGKVDRVELIKDAFQVEPWPGG